MSQLRDLSFKEFSELYYSGKIEPETETIEVTQEMNNTFMRLSRSTCPVHTDDEFAKSLGYERTISYGLMYEVLAVNCSEMLTGKNVIGYQWNVSFRKPVFVGDKLTVKCEAIRIVKSTRNVIEKITVTNAETGEVKSDIIVKCKFLK